MPPKFAQSPWYLLAIVLLLALPQARAFVRQFELGYVPFRESPERVTFSWDMFAIAMERCSVTWSPPIRWGDRTLAKLSDLGAPIEWDPVYNDHSDYLLAARVAACTNHAPGSPQRYQVHCFVADGEERNDDLACP